MTFRQHACKASEPAWRLRFRTDCNKVRHSRTRYSQTFVGIPVSPAFQIYRAASFTRPWDMRKKGIAAISGSSGPDYMLSGPRDSVRLMVTDPLTWLRLHDGTLLSYSPESVYAIASLAWRLYQASRFGFQKGGAWNQYPSQPRQDRDGPGCSQFLVDQQQQSSRFPIEAERDSCNSC